MAGRRTITLLALVLGGLLVAGFLVSVASNGLRQAAFGKASQGSKGRMAPLGGRPPAPAREVEIGEISRPGEIGGRLEGGAAVVYSVAFEPDHAFAAEVFQEGTDLVAELLDPAGRTVVKVDSPIGGYGPELVCFVARTRGRYRLLLRSFGASAGSFRLQVHEIGLAERKHRQCAEASARFAEAEEQRLAGSAPPLQLINVYQRAQDLWHSSGYAFQEAMALRQMGRLWSLLDHVDKQKRCLEEALKRLAGKELSLQQGAGLRVSLLNLLGSLEILLADPVSARASLESALALARKIGDRWGEATALNNFALLEKSLGHVHRAILLYESALALWQGLGEAREAAVTRQNQGIAQASIGHPDEALGLLLAALESHRRFGDKVRQASCLIAIGWIRYLEGDPWGALTRLREAVGVARSAKAVREEVAALDRLGTVYRQLGQLSAAESAYRLSLTGSEASGNLRDIAHTRANLGWLLYDRGQLQRAEEELQRACLLFERLRDRAGLAHARAGLATVLRERGDLAMAQRHAETAVELVESLEASSWEFGVLAHVESLWLDRRELLVELLMERQARESEGGFAERAFEAGQLLRAKTLHRRLLEGSEDLREGVDSRLLQRERRARERLNAIDRRRMELLAMGGKPETVDLLDAVVAQRVMGLERIEAEIRRASPRFARIEPSERISLGMVQDLLDPGTRLISFQLGKERSFAFVIGPRTFQSYSLPPRDALEELAMAFYRALRNSHQTRTRSQINLLSEQLAARLIWPMEKELAAPGVKRLVFVGDGLLHYLPFSTLPFPMAEAPVGEGLLLDRFGIVHLPSIAVLARLRAQEESRSPARWKLAVIADPVTSDDDRRLSASSSLPVPSYPALPFSRVEAETIIASVPSGRILTGFRANRNLVLGGQLADYQIVHFATHAAIDEVHPELSGIVLSLFDERGRPQEGVLRLHEIYTLRLPAALVVLSGCRTALGQRVEGDGLVGLTHGFFHAGATRLLVSLWDVQDRATAELMGRFYFHLLVQGAEPAQALAQAQRWMRSRASFRAPYYWAGFVLQGDWRDLPATADPGLAAR